MYLISHRGQSAKQRKVKSEEMEDTCGSGGERLLPLKPRGTELCSQNLRQWNSSRRFRRKQGLDAHAPHVRDAPSTYTVVNATSNNKNIT